jgi:hypothetical protein
VSTVPTDAEYCPRCGEEIPPANNAVTADEVLDVYRTKFVCTACEFRGEVFRTDFGSDGDLDVE